MAADKKKSSFGEQVGGLIIILIIIAVVVRFCSSGDDSTTLDSKIKNTYVRIENDGTYTDTEVTLGEALESVFENTEWKTDSSFGMRVDASVEYVVEVTGTYKEDGEEVPVTIRWQIYKSTGDSRLFTFHSMSIGDQEGWDSVYWDLLSIAMENFGFEEGHFR